MLKDLLKAMSPIASKANQLKRSVTLETVPFVASAWMLVSSWLTYLSNLVSYCANAESKVDVSARDIECAFLGGGGGGVG